MTSFYPEDTPEARVRSQIVDALRRYGPDATKVGHLFAAQQGLQFTDLQALVAIMSAEGSGHPLTAGQLREHLGLSSGGTSYVIDRLVKSGHVRRSRDHPGDNRVVHLHYTEAGQATALAFFGPLGAQAEAAMDRFSPAELEVIAAFMTEIADGMHRHVEALEAGEDPIP